MDALEAAGGEACARFVGGAVRNAVLGVAIDDVDIATTLSPQAVIAALKTAGLRAIPTGVDHGTVTAISQSRPFEVTTLRKDVETDGRRAVVAFTQDWEEDARRRDFTLNALYADRAGVIFDPVGTGLADARAGRIVFVGDAETRIAEDYLRILRFFRFFAWYGRGEADVAALEACAKMAPGMARLAAERISKELLKLLAAPNPRAALMMMASTGVLAQTAPSASNVMRLAKLVRVEGEAGAAPDALLRLGALLPDDEVEAVRTAQRLRLSNAQRGRLAAALTTEPPIRRTTTSPEARRAIYEIGTQAFQDRVLLAWASDGPGETAPWLALRELARTWAPPAFPLTGDDALASGAAPGPAVGEALRLVERWWVDGDFTADRTAALRTLSAVVGGAA
jgi:poly(A) polymerase